MAVQPGLTYVLQRVLDMIIGEIADVRGASGVVRGTVEGFLRLGQQIQPGEEEGHRRVVVLGHFQKAREEAVADLARPVPGKDHELRGRLAGFEPDGGIGLVGLLPGVGGGAVTDQAGLALRRTVSAAGVALAGVTLVAAALGGAGGTGEAATGESDRGRRAEPRAEQSPSIDVAHAVPICGRFISRPYKLLKSERPWATRRFRAIGDFLYALPCGGALRAGGTGPDGRPRAVIRARRAASGPRTGPASGPAARQPGTLRGTRPSCGSDRFHPGTLPRPRQGRNRCRCPDRRPGRPPYPPASPGRRPGTPASTRSRGRRCGRCG